MNKQWLTTAFLVLISASVASAGTAFWFTEKHKEHERAWAQQLEHTIAAVRAEAAPKATSSSPTLLPFWLLQKAMAFAKSKGLCITADGKPCAVEDQSATATALPTANLSGKQAAKTSTVAAVPVNTVKN